MGTRRTRMTRYFGIALLVVLNGYSAYLSLQPICIDPDIQSFVRCAAPMQWDAYVRGTATGADLVVAVVIVACMPPIFRGALWKRPAS